MWAVKFYVTFINEAMSRIGKKPITVPSGVTVAVDKGNVVKVKGAKGELTRAVDPDITVEVKEGQVQVTRPTDHKRHRALHGLYRTLISNMVQGVSNGYERNLELVGVGYKAEAKGQLLELNVGYSHTVVIMLPKEIAVSTLTEKGSNPKIFLKGLDKEMVGHFAAKIRSIRPPEPYKGKGIKYSDEIIRRKAGKAAAKA
jgi:large subunit ribosomal protein L6